jgi:hypothetical protein
VFAYADDGALEALFPEERASSTRCSKQFVKWLNA